MEPAEDVGGPDLPAPSPTAPAPVFVDDTGRRRVLTRRAGRVLVIGFTAYLGLLVIGFARDPRVGSIHLPTFGLPSLGLAAPPDPSVLGEQAERTGAGTAIEVAAGGTGAGSTGQPTRSGVASDGQSMSGAGARAGVPGVPAGGSGSGSAPAGTGSGASAGPGTTTTTAAAPPTTISSRNPGNGLKPTTSTTAPSSTTTTTSATTSTANAGPGSGQGSGQGTDQETGPVSAKGPDGGGAPGQQRKPTSTTTG